MYRLLVGIILFTAALFHGKEYKNYTNDDTIKTEQSKEVTY